MLVVAEIQRWMGAMVNFLSALEDLKHSLTAALQEF